MNAIEVLGAILGKRAASASGPQRGGQQRGVQQGGGNIGGLGRDILNHVLEKKRREKAAEQARQRTAQRSHRHGGERLEDIMHDVHGRWQQRPGAQPQRSHASHGHQHHHPHHGYDDNQLNERSVVLIRAMINAAKADGEIDKCEQDEIVGRLGRLDSEEARFLQQEFRRPLDVHAFAHDVPRGMEEEVYAISLMAIDLDTRPEAHYLTELAGCLRLDPCVCNDIHEHYGAPKIFR